MGRERETRGKTQRYTLKTKTSPQKKVLSLVLCVAMLLSVMVMGTGAAFTDQDEIQNAEAVDMTSALGIIDGYEDGSFQPAENIERGEAAKMISAMLNGGRDSVQETTESSYNDVLGSVDAWANKYIEYCTARGVVSGVGGDRFAPASNVTGTQLAKMLLVSLGYDSVKEGYQDNAMWSVNVNTDAVAAGLYAGIETIDMSAPLSRDNAAQMIWNALQANTVYYLTDISDVTVTETTLLADVYGASITSGIMTDVYHYNKDAGTYVYTIGDKMKVSSTVDYSDMFAMNVTVVSTPGGNALNIYADKSDILVEGTLGDIQDYKDLGTNSTVVIAGEKFGVDNLKGDTLNVVNFNEYTTDKFDGSQSNAVGIWNNNVAVQYGFRAIDTDNGGDINTIVVYPYAVLSVDDVDSDDFTVSKITAQDAKLYPNANAQYYASQMNGAKVVNYDDVIVNGDLAKDGYVMFVPAVNTAENIDTYTALTIQTATPSSLSAKDMLVTLNGTEYDGALLTPVQQFASISLVHDYNYVEVNGYLFMMDGAGVQADANYAVVTDVAANTTGTTAKVWTTDLLLTDGSTVTVSATSQETVGTMVTYQENNAGDYVLTAVNDGKLNDNTSVYDIQEAYMTGATLNESNGGWPTLRDATTNRYNVDKAGQYFLNKAGNDKYYIEDDAVIFVYYSGAGDKYYDVISGAELDAADVVGDVAWAFTGASEKAGGETTVDLGYVAISHDIDEVTYTAYIDSWSDRLQDENGDFYATIDVMMPGGEMQTMETKHFDLIEEAQLLKDMYNLVPNNLYDITVLDGQVVHIETAAKQLSTITVDTVGWDGDNLRITAKNGKTYLVTEDTNVYNIAGKELGDINQQDKVWILAKDKTATSPVELSVIVYDD